MKTNVHVLILALLLPATTASGTGNNPAKSPVRGATGRQHFIENKGQVHNLSDRTPNADVLFMLEGPGMKVFLMRDGISTQFEKTHYPEGYLELMREKHHDEVQQQQLEGLRKAVRLETWRVDMRLEGANPAAVVTTEGKSADYTQYYNHDALFVHHYQKVTYKDVYPGIDWVVYTTESGMKHDFVVHPGADPGRIRMRYTHQESLGLDAQGNLELRTGMGGFAEQAPVAFQGEDTVRTAFRLEGDVVGFGLDDYDKGRPLVIDPVVRLWGTYYGGAESEFGYSTTATDASGNVYLAGSTFSTSGIASGGHQNVIDFSLFNEDAFLIKFNGNGVRQWGTYYGGTGSDDGYSTTTDASGNVYLAGYTASSSGISTAGHQNSLGGTYDAFLVKFNGAGVRQWGTYYGGYGDDRGLSTSTDASGNVYLAGYTQSISGIASGGHQNSLGGQYDAFLVKFNGTGVRQWGSYYGGGPDDDIGYSTATDVSGNVYLAGYTQCTSGIASGGHQNSFGGGTGGTEDAFLVKFNGAGVRQWGTYYGGPDSDYALSTATDPSGNVYLAGTTDGTTAIASGGHQNSLGGNVDGFLVKFSSSGIRQWGTYYGGAGSDFGNSTATDPSGNVYLAGGTNSTAGIAASGHQNSPGGSNDAFLVKFNGAGVRQWGTFYGGPYSDDGSNTSLDAFGNVYLAGITQSISGIDSAGHQNTFAGGSSDAFLVKFSECASAASITQSACGSYTLNGQTYTQSGSYTQTILNAAGCDSVITLNLTVTTLTASVGLAGGTLTATPAGATYQWVDCNAGFVPVAGATSQVFSPTVSGSYAAVVVSGPCTDTSACTSVVVVGLEDNFQDIVALHPNPTDGLTVVTGLPAEGTYTLLDAQGRILRTGPNAPDMTLDLGGLPAGVYSLRFTHPNGTATRKVVLQK